MLANFNVEQTGAGTYTVSVKIKTPEQLRILLEILVDQSLPPEPADIQVSVGTVDGKFDHAVVVPPCGTEQKRIYDQEWDGTPIYGTEEEIAVATGEKQTVPPT